MSSEEAEKFFNEGLQHSNNGEYLKAIDCFTKIIDITENNLEYAKECSRAYNAKGNTLSILSRYEEALKFYDTAIEKYSNNSNAYSGKGNALNNLGRYEEALKYYDTAIEVNPNNTYAYKNRLICNSNIAKQKDSTFTGFKDCSNMVDCAVESNGGNVIGIDGCDNVSNFEMKVKSNSGSNITVAKDSSNLKNIKSEIEINSNDDLFNEIERLAETLKDNTEILNSISEMRNNVSTPSFKQKYTDFMSLTADYVTVFLPILTALSKLL